MYIREEKIFIEFTTEWELKTVEIWEFKKWFWINFVLDVNHYRIKVVAKSLWIDATIKLVENLTITWIKFLDYNLQSYTVTNFSKIWYPGYYKNIEVLDWNHVDLLNYSLFRNYFSVNEDDKYYKYALNYPKNSYRTDSYSLTLLREISIEHVYTIIWGKLLRGWNIQLC